MSIFVDSNGSPLRFLIIPKNKTFKLVKENIIENGGKLSKTHKNSIILCTDKNYLFGLSLKARKNKKFYDKCFVEDCIKTNKLLKIENYLIKPFSEKPVLAKKHSAVVLDTDLAKTKIDYKKINKFGNERQKLLGRKVYDREDDLGIINYLKEMKEKGITKFKGKNVWLNLANSGKIEGRSWQSLRERYLKHLKGLE